ncbi:MAG: glycosyltransferase family 4 protein [Calothrix sp. MO_167.B42]|nr:glycosyltransferase family 4 protein [Calothrix sp. MO_167.B42]
MLKKFLDEMVEFSALWPGNMRVFVEQDKNKREVLETVTVNPQELPFNLEIISADRLGPGTFSQNASIVYVSAAHKYTNISKYCQIAKIPSIYYSECTLKTRQQIKTLSTNNPILRLRRNLWEKNTEKKYIKAIKLANGFHANGTPTYDVYRQINSNSLLYFDNRVPRSLLAKNEDIQAKAKYLCDRNQPLRLCFSGRLIKIKGAEHLIDIAQELRKLRVPFQMFICGDGELKDKMQSQIATRGLENFVQLMGNLNFHSQLIPFIKHNIDLFVCCHRQGDPSCTYLETMSCGVPIIGYANEAFSGVVKCSEAGWLIDMNAPKLMAQKIAELNNNRQMIKQMSFKALDFASQHYFEATYEKRVNHLYKTYLDYNFDPTKKDMFQSANAAN